MTDDEFPAVGSRWRFKDGASFTILAERDGECVLSRRDDGTLDLRKLSWFTDGVYVPVPLPLPTPKVTERWVVVAGNGNTAGIHTTRYAAVAYAQYHGHPAVIRFVADPDSVEAVES